MGGPSIGIVGGKAGDWLCSGCGDLNFSRRDECRKCNGPKSAGTPAPVRGGMSGGGMGGGGGGGGAARPGE